MNEIVNKSFKLGKPVLTYSAWGPFIKNNEGIQKF